MIAAARPWTYWLSIPLFAGSVLCLLTWGYVYLRKAVAAKYPADGTRSERMMLPDPVFASDGAAERGRPRVPAR